MNNSVFCEIILITEVLEINDLFLMKEQAIDSLLQSFMESKYIEKKKNFFNRLNLMNGWNLEKNS